MASEIVINATLPEIRIALIEDGEISDLATEYERSKGVVGNIYKGRVTRVLPGMQAAFVDIGLERAAFLYVGDVVTDTMTPADSGARAMSSRQHDMKLDEDDGGDLEIDPGAYIEDKSLEALESGETRLREEKETEEGPEDGPAEMDEEELAEELSEDSEEAARPVGREAERGRPSRFKRNNFRSRERSSGGPPNGRNGKQRSRRSVKEQPNIQDVLREGQEIVVQVTKEQMGTKGARLTCHLALPGRHVVLMPTVDHVGVSRKIGTDQERRRLRDCINELRPPGMGFIVRTMAEGASTETITNEVNYLLGLYSEIRTKKERGKSPALLHEDLGLVLRTVRDQFTDDIYRVVIDSPRVYEYVLDYVGGTAPHLKNRVVRYTGKDPIFDAYGINSEISRALQRKVWLKSGGYLIIDQAEALTVVDVNTGKFIGKKSFEETILKTNLEAVAEVAYQLRLRDAGGIIIIDLIDMERGSHREQVYRALEQALRKDKAKTNILKISELGLIQMTRKRTKESLVQIFCQPCPYCKGNGQVKNIRTICYDIFREIERTALEGGITGASIVGHPEVVDYLYQKERDTLDRLEERFGMKISLRGDASVHLEAFEVSGERLSVSSRPSSASSSAATPAS